MGYERTDPKNKVIAGVAVGTVVLLIAMQFVFDSYFEIVRSEETQDKILGTEPVEYAELKATMEDALENGKPLPIEGAFAELMGGARPGIISAKSEPEELDTSAIEGWGTLADQEAAKEAKIDFAEYRLKQIVARLDAATASGNKEEIVELRALATERTKVLAKLMQGASTEVAEKSAAAEEEAAEAHSPDPASESTTPAPAKSAAKEPPASAKPVAGAPASKKTPVKPATRTPAHVKPEATLPVMKKAVVKPAGKKRAKVKPKATLPVLKKAVVKPATKKSAKVKPGATPPVMKKTATKPAATKPTPAAPHREQTR